MTRNSFIFNIYWKWEVDAFCGRTQKSILIRHYPDLSPERLKKNYDKANLSPILIPFLKDSKDYIKNIDASLYNQQQ